MYHGLGLHEAEFDSKEQVIELSAYLFAYPVLLAFSLFVSKAAVVAFLLMIVVDKLYAALLFLPLRDASIIDYNQTQDHTMD